MQETILQIIFAGLYSLYNYLSAHVFTCLVPAFFIAGAMSALLSKDKIVNHLGSEASKPKAYFFAVLAGLLLAVCSCTILPLFAGIRKKGAGIGPAIAFLYTAPATNILAIALTGNVLGWQFAVSRIVLSIFFAVMIGIIITRLFKEDNGAFSLRADKKPESKNVGFASKLSGFLKDREILFLVNLFAILIAGASSRIIFAVKLPLLIIFLALVVLQAKRRFSKDEIKNWLAETFSFFKMIFPLLLAGIFVAGMLSEIFPKDSLGKYVGDNSLNSNFLAVIFGMFMYFPTLVEVPMAKMFLGLGMAFGPLLAYLLADPVISLPSILAIRKIIGTKKTLVYAGLIIIFCTISGIVYGFLIG